MLGGTCQWLTRALSKWCDGGKKEEQARPARGTAWLVGKQVVPEDYINDLYYLNERRVNRWTRPCRASLGTTSQTSCNWTCWWDSRQQDRLSKASHIRLEHVNGSLIIVFDPLIGFNANTRHRRRWSAILQVFSYQWMSVGYSVHDSFMGSLISVLLQIECYYHHVKGVSLLKYWGLFFQNSYLIFAVYECISTRICYKNRILSDGNDESKHGLLYLFVI